MKTVLNSYSRRARLEPALIAALPLGLATVAWFPTGVVGWGLFWGLIAWSGGTALLAQIAREPGKKKEAHLFASWGGKPTTRFLRHRDAPNKVILERRHRKLARLVPDLHIPSANQEQADPKKADEVYEACTAFLIERTRDVQEFPLIFEENCNYGFRRNLWGMKPIGIALPLLGTAAVLILVGLDFAKNIMPGPIVFIAALVDIFLAVGWLFYFTSDWVKTTAEAYAERLLAASENLGLPK
jgi:hypothetical protein